MSATNADFPQILSVPPLSVAPHWATAPSPKKDTIQALSGQVTHIHSQLDPLSHALATVAGPSPEQLEKVSTASIKQELAQIVAELRAMPYPAELTAWINDARVLAARAAARFDECLGDLQHLYALRSARSRAYRDTLRALRQTIDTLVETLEQLQSKLQTYRPVEAPPDRAAPVIHLPEHMRQRGRQEGLCEALNLVQEMLVDVCSPELDQALELLRDRLHELIQRDVPMPEAS